MTRRAIARAAFAVVTVVALFATPTGNSPRAAADTTSPLRQFDAEFQEIVINAEGGESVTVDFVLTVRGLERGIIEVDAEAGDSRFLTTVTSDFEGMQWITDTRVEWSCDSATCDIPATLRFDLFTDTSGIVRVNASGGVSADEVPVDAVLDIVADDAMTGVARVYELEHSLIEYPDTGDQAPHSAVDLIEYDLGNPSDEIQLVVRPVLGAVALDSPSTLPTPAWAQALIPMEASGACVPNCAGSALVRVGPSDFSNLEYQVLAYSDRPGAARTLRATRKPLAATTEIGFVTLTPDQPVVAIPITLSGDVESTRLMADVGVRGRSSFVTLRPVGDTSFEPEVQWASPRAGETQYELAISSPDTQLGDVTISWTVSLFTLPGAMASIEVGEPGPAQFAAGELGDPAQFIDLTSPGEGPGSGPPWALILGGAAVAAAGGAGALRYRSRRS